MDVRLQEAEPARSASAGEPERVSLSGSVVFLRAERGSFGIMVTYDDCIPVTTWLTWHLWLLASGACFWSLLPFLAFDLACAKLDLLKLPRSAVHNPILSSNCIQMIKNNK